MILIMSVRSPPPPLSARRFSPAPDPCLHAHKMVGGCVPANHFLYIFFHPDQCGTFDVAFEEQRKRGADFSVPLFAENVAGHYDFLWQSLQLVGPFFDSSWHPLQFLCAMSLPNPSILPPASVA